jgi:class 3 adenylate cyclase
LSIENVFKSNKKPICIYALDGELVFGNIAFQLQFKTETETDLFEYVMMGRPLGNQLTWNCNVIKGGINWDIHASIDDASGTLCIIADDIDQYISHEKELIGFYDQHMCFIKSLYPQHIIDALFNKDVRNIARQHTNVTICFADVRGFTSMCSSLKPEHVMSFLNKLFGGFDLLLKKHDIFKLETVGDCYVTVSGLMTLNNDGSYVLEPKDAVVAANNMLAFAKDMMDTAFVTRLPGTNDHVEMRVGIHTGDVTSGIIDNVMPKFCLFGDAMNTASRMESTGKPMHIHVSEPTYALANIKKNFRRRSTDVKGKGEMTTYMMNCANKLHSASMSDVDFHVSTELRQTSSATNFNNLMKFANITTKRVINATRKSFDMELKNKLIFERLVSFM